MPFISTIVAAVGSVATAIGAAGSIGAAIAGGAGLAATAINTALSFGLSLGLSALSSSLGTKPKRETQQPGMIAASVQVGGNIPRQVAFGHVAVKGQLAFAATAGASKERLCLIYILSDGWTGNLRGIWVNDQLEARTLEESQHGETSRWTVDRFGTADTGEKRCQVIFYDGRPGQPANPIPHDFAPDRFDTTDRFAGMAYVIVHLINDQDTFDQIPDFLFEIDGYRCHDPRKDPAFGGSGSHSLDDPATWEPTDNPALHVLAYLRGIVSEGQVFMGMEVQPFDLLIETFVAAANVCDESVPLEEGGSEARYRASHVITAEDGDHRAALAPVLQSIAGYLIESAGAFGIVPGVAYVPVATITDDDIVWGRGAKWSGSLTRTQRTNEVHGQFVDRTVGWQANSYPPVTSALYSAEDGERLAVSLDFSAITSATQAQRVARARMRETRRQASATITLGFHYCWLEPGDWIGWNSAIYKANKLYRIMSRDLNPDDTVTLALREVGNEIYSWNSADEAPINPIPLLPGPGVLPSTVEGFAVQADVKTGADGSTRPVVICSWTPITDQRIIAVVIEYRQIGTIAATRVRDDSPYDGEFVLDQPPTGQDYEFRASIVSRPARPTTWTPWISMAALKSARWLVDARALTAQFRGEIEWMPVLMPDLAALAWNTVMTAVSADGKAEASIRRVEEVAVTEFEARATFAIQVNARFDQTDASVTLVQQSVASATSAVATLTLQVAAKANQSDLDSTNATVNVVQSAVASNTGSIATHTTQIEANSTQIGTLTGSVSSLSGTVTVQGAAITDLYSSKATVSYAASIEATANAAWNRANSASAGGQFDMFAETGPGGPFSRIRARAWTDDSGFKVDAGWMIDIISGVGTLSFFADRFVFVDPFGGNPFSPLAYSGGQWVLNGSLTINGNAVINGTLSVFKMASNTLTFGSESAGGGVSLPTALPGADSDTSWKDVHSASMTPLKDGRLIMLFDYFGTVRSRYSDGQRTMAFRIVRRKSGVDTEKYPETQFSGGSGGANFGHDKFFADQPGAGFVEYVFQHRFVSQSGGVSAGTPQGTTVFCKFVWFGGDT